MCRLLLVFSIFFFSLNTTAQNAVGHWTEQLSYTEVFDLSYDQGRVFCTIGEGVFTYDVEQGYVERYTKVNGLNDVGVSSVAYSASEGIAIVGYSNGNLDILRGEDIINLSDITRSGIIGDLSIRNIDIIDNRAWLSCGFGIVVIDTEAVEVVDTYIIGDQGSSAGINALVIDPDRIYAATDEGIKTAPTSSNLADFNAWTRLSMGLPAPADEYLDIVRFGDELIIIEADGDEAAYSYDGLLWSQIPGTLDENPQDLYVSGDRLLITYNDHLNIRGATLNSIESIFSYPFDPYLELNAGVLTEAGDLLIADKASGLVHKTGEEFESVIPDGPLKDVAWSMDALDGELWIAHGELLDNFDNAFSNNAFSGFDGAQWKHLKGSEGLESVRDMIDIEIHPAYPNKIFVASFRGGLISYDRVEDQMLVEDDQTLNGTIEASSLLPDRVQVSGVEVDAGANIWVTNSYTEKGWKIKKRDGTWIALGCETELSPTTLYGDMVITEAGQTWTILPRGNAVVVYGHNNDLDNPNDHECKKLSTAVGDGALPTNTVLSMAVDLDGEIWIGTSEGPVVNFNPLSIFSNNATDFQSILVERDGNVERLLGSESITAIAVDGANRKWLGTLTGGVFLLSEDGTEEVHHFTTENSPLLSNVIKDIAIDPITGVVHFATNAGVISYTSDATEGLLENTCFDVYPNPVRPEYQGMITMDGLMFDSEVKITDLAGNVVFQTTANGGRAVWPGTDFSGQRVSTGVYFALVADREGSSTCVSKILFIN